MAEAAGRDERASALAGTDECAPRGVARRVAVDRSHGSVTRSSGISVGNGLPANHASRFALHRSPIACRVSRVALPTCGSSTTLSIAKSGSGMLGSSANTSSPAPLIVPACSAATSAGSSMIEPRAILTIVPFLPSAASTSALTMFFVAAPPGQATTRKSDSAASVFRSGTKRYGDVLRLAPGVRDLHAHRRHALGDRLADASQAQDADGPAARASS